MKKIAFALCCAVVIAVTSCGTQKSSTWNLGEI